MANFFAVLSFLSFFISTLATIPSHIGKRDDLIQFAIILTWGDVNPTGGISRKAVLMNGTTPGPPLTMKLGQTVEFAVYNQLPVNSTIHFHGITHQATPYSDGTPGVTQWPIPPGQSYLYHWIATEPGYYFYHAHDKGQMVDGAYGAIYVEATDNSARPFSLINSDPSEQSKMLAAEANYSPVFISDWTQYTFEEYYQIEAAANVDSFCADSIVINGQGAVYCLPRQDINALTNPIVKPLLSLVTPSQLTDKGCLPPNLVPIQGRYTQDLSALPNSTFYACTPSTGQNATFIADPAAGYAALTFINPASFSSFKVTIDSHKMWVYAVSGAYIVPQLVDEIIVVGGDRFSVMVKLDQPVGTYTIRVANNGYNQIVSGFAALQYLGSTGPAAGAVSVMNYAGANTTTITIFNDKAAAPYSAAAPAGTADASYLFDIKKINANYMWTETGTSPYLTSNDQQYPLLFQDPNTVPASEFIIKTKANQWVDLIVKVEGPVAEPHPLHKHGNKMWMIASGTGPFNYTSAAQAAASLPPGTFNFANPPYRDGFSTLTATGTMSWMILRYLVDGPGAWLFHCHMQSHFSGGMAAVILDGVDNFPTIPAAYLNGNGFGFNSNATQSFNQTGNFTSTTTFEPTNTPALNSTSMSTSASARNGTSTPSSTPALNSTSTQRSMSTSTTSFTSSGAPTSTSTATLSGVSTLERSSTSSTMSTPTTKPIADGTFTSSNALSSSSGTMVVSSSASRSMSTSMGPSASGSASTSSRAFTPISTSSPHQGSASTSMSMLSSSSALIGSSATGSASTRKSTICNSEGSDPSMTSSSVPSVAGNDSASSGSVDGDYTSIFTTTQSCNETTTTVTRCSSCSLGDNNPTLTVLGGSGGTGVVTSSSSLGNVDSSNPGSSSVPAGSGSPNSGSAGGSSATASSPITPYTNVASSTSVLTSASLLIGVFCLAIAFTL